MTGVIRVHLLAERELVSTALASLLATDGAVDSVEVVGTAADSPGDAGSASRRILGPWFTAGGSSERARDVLLIHLGTVARAGEEFQSDASAAARSAADRGMPIVVIAAGPLPADWPAATLLPPEVSPEELFATIRGA